MTAVANKPVFRPILTEAQRILRLIESVGADTPDRMLDEIDARVFCWLNDLTFIRLRARLTVPDPRARYVRYAFRRYDGFRQGAYLRKGHQYTRSADARRAIRPPGWESSSWRRKEFPLDDLAHASPFWGDYEHTFTQSDFSINQWTFIGRSPHSEGLAELAAVMRALDFVREQKAGSP